MRGHAKQVDNESKCKRQLGIGKSRRRGGEGWLLMHLKL